MLPIPHRRTLREAAALVVVGLALGITCNAPLLLGAWTTPAVVAPAPPVVATRAAYPQPVLLAEVQALLAGGAVAIDARDSSLYAAGHLPQARSLPLAEAKTAADLATRFPAGRTLLVYCGGYGCSDSFDLALLLIAAGHSDVRVFEGGWPEWHDAGLAVESGGGR